MRPQEALETIQRGIEASDAFNPPSIITEEPDFQGRNNRLHTPFVTITASGTTRNTSLNTDRVGFTRDTAGNVNGEIYEPVFRMNMQVDVYLAAGDDRSVTELGGRLRRALLQFDSAALDDDFPDDGTGIVPDIRDFDAGTGQQADDLSGPGFRRWRHSVQMRYVARIVSTEGVSAFETIVTPTDPELEPVDADEDEDEDTAEFEYRIVAQT